MRSTARHECRVLEASGHAAYTPAFPLDVGDVVSATYSGDAALAWSAGDAPLDVLPASTATTLVSSRNPVPQNEETDVVVTVANRDTDVAPFGSVEVSIDGSPIGDAALDENGQVAFSLLADVPAGNYTVRVDYADDTADIADFRPSSASFVQRVTEPPTTTPPTPGSVVQPPVAVVGKRDLARFGALIAKALRRRGFAALRDRTPVFAAAAPGTLSEQISARRRLPAARRSRVRRTLTAAGRRTFSSPSSGRLRLRLTGKGKRLIRHAKRLDIEIATRFVPTTGSSVSTIKRTRVSRRCNRRAQAAILRCRDPSAAGGRSCSRWGEPRFEWPHRNADTSGSP